MKTSTLPRQEFKRLLKEQTMSRQDILAWIDDVAGCLVIGVGMLKGGTGKTTSTIYLALYLAVVLGLKVCVIDTDDNSQTVDSWYKNRENRDEKVPFDLVVYDPKDEDGPDLDDLITDLSEKFQVVLVDIGGAGKETYWELCSKAHMLLLPVAPSGYETVRIPPSIKVAQKGGKANETINGLNIFVVMVKCDGRTTLPEEQRAALTASLSAIGQLDALTDEKFQISNAPHYPRSWETTPRRSDLEEFGLLFRHCMREVTA